MKESATVRLFAFYVGFLMFLPCTALAAQPDRKQAEREIRQMVYELGYAQKTGDIETMKKLTAHRALDLYRFAFDVLLAKALMAATSSGSPESAPAALPGGYGDEALSFVLNLAADATGKALTPDQIKAMARVEAARPIAFINDRKARIYGSEKEATVVFAIFEDGRWKMDDTEAVKAVLLDLDKNSAPDSPMLTSEQRERLRKF
jgi:hypothetical protein